MGRADIATQDNTTGCGGITLQCNTTLSTMSLCDFPLCGVGWGGMGWALSREKEDSIFVRNLLKRFSIKENRNKRQYFFIPKSGVLSHVLLHLSLYLRLVSHNSLKHFLLS